jgi:kumamolisin
MAAPKKRITVSGSQKKAVRDAKVIGKVDPNERIEITVVLRPRRSREEPRTTEEAVEEAMSLGRQPPEQRHYQSREELATQRGAAPEDVVKIETLAQEHHLTVVEVSLPKRTMRLAGTVANLTASFRPNLKRAMVGRRVVRMRTGGISIPKALEDSIIAVLGFDDRVAARQDNRLLERTTARPAKADLAAKRSKERTREQPARKGAPPTVVPAPTLTPLEVAHLYNFPTELDGAGQCIALIELNDFDRHHKPIGMGFSRPDLKAYFASLGLPTPHVTAIGVASNGGVGANVPGKDPGTDREVMLDIKVAGAVAPKAKIAVYFALLTDDGFLAALNAALHDDVRNPSVISISWGSAEDFQTEQLRKALQEALIDASMLGVTVCCSAGDLGSSDLPPSHQDRHPHVHFPASLPLVLACGGTTLRGSGTTITSEVVWNAAGLATGGGVSNCFPRPRYQSDCDIPKSPKDKVGRGVPDVAGDAHTGGTSAVAPLWAGLIALINQRLASLGKQRVGFLNPLLYQLPPATGAFHDIVEGNNDIEGLGKYQAGPGWDPCTGLGTPDGRKLLAALGG